MEPIAETHGVNKPTNLQLRRRVPAPDLAHIGRPFILWQFVHESILLFPQRLEKFRCLARELFHKPAKNFPLICNRGTANLNQELPGGGAVQGQILCSLIAHGADSTQIGGVIRSSHGLVFYVSNVKARLPAVVGMQFASDGAAHLAGITVPIQDLRSSFF